MVSPTDRTIYAYRHSIGFQELLADLPAPRRGPHVGPGNAVATSLHWTSTPSYPLVLLVTYMRDGIV